MKVTHWKWKDVRLIFCLLVRYQCFSFKKASTHSFIWKISYETYIWMSEVNSSRRVSVRGRKFYSPVISSSIASYQITSLLILTVNRVKKTLLVNQSFLRCLSSVLKGLVWEALATKLQTVTPIWHVWMKHVVSIISFYSHIWKYDMKLYISICDAMVTAQVHASQTTRVYFPQVDISWYH